MRLIVSGSRDGFSQRRIDEVLDGYLGYAQLTIVEGCATGVDSQAETWARRHGAIEVLGRERGYRGPAIARLVLEHWPAQWTKHEGCFCAVGKPRCNYAGHRRNLEMRDSHVDQVVCFHPDIRASRGTRNMAEKAAAHGLPVRLIGSTMPL